MPSPAAQTQRETDDGVATAAKDSPGRVNSDSIPESDTEIDSNAEFQSRIRKEREISPTALSEEPDALSESTETHESDQQTSPPITEIDTLNAFEMHSRSGLQKALAIVSLAIGLMLYALDAVGCQSSRFRMISADYRYSLA